jgi:hypothetical protein
MIKKFILVLYLNISSFIVSDNDYENDDVDVSKKRERARKKLKNLKKAKMMMSWI